MTSRTAIAELAAVVAYALSGWAVAAAAMSLAIWKTPAPDAALSAHAIVVPLAFAMVAFVYFRRAYPLRPVAAAAFFGTTVLVMDALAILVFHRAADVRALLLGAVLPACAAFLSGWLTGIVSSLTITEDRRR